MVKSNLILLIMLSLLLISAPLWRFSPVPRSVANLAFADEYDDLQKQKEETQDEINRKKLDEDKTKRKQGSVQGGISATKTQIGSIDTQLRKTEKEIKELDSSRKVSEGNLTQKKDQRDLLIRLIYKRSRFNALEAFLSAQSFASLARSFGYYRATTLEKLRQIKVLSASVVGLKLDLKAAGDRKSQLETNLKNLNSQKRNLETELSSLNSYLNNLTSQITGLQGTLSSLTARQEAYIREKLSATAQFTSVGEIEQAKQTLPIPPFSPAFAVISIGYPHRVGLNQYGAYGRAKSGQNAFDILRAYYANIEIREDYEVPETIDVAGYGRIPFEDLYMKGIAEMPSSWGDKGGLEALKAQAIAARSYALSVTNNGAGSICASQWCQVFIGTNKGGKWEEAVNSTHKDSRHATVMLFNGQPVKAYYSSTFGGYSRLPTDFDVGWNSSFDFLKRIKDADGGSNAFDGPRYGDSPWYYRAWYTPSDAHPWLTKEEMRDLLNSALLPEAENVNLSQPTNGGLSFDEVRNRLKSYGTTPLDDFSAVQPLFSEDGYTSLLRVITSSGHTDVDGKRFRKVFILRSRGNLALWSSLYDVVTR